MARTRKVADPYEIDFKFPERNREFLFAEDGSSRYTIPQLLDYAASRGDEYALNFTANVRAKFERDGFITDSQKWTLENMAAAFTPEWDAFNAKFFTWYDSRPEMQEVYKATTENSWWFYDRGGQHHNSEHARNMGWMDRPDNWAMFQTHAYGHAGSKYRELKREVVYDVGDMVQLRTPMVGSWRYDPLYQGGDRTSPRIGTVMEHTEEISNKSRGGKGSRLINVLWLSNGQRSAVPERVLKKLPKQKA